MVYAHLLELLYRVIQRKEVNIVGCDTIGHREQTNWNEPAPKSERLPMWSPLNLQI